MSSSVRRLEQALTVWEDTYFVLNTMVRAQQGLRSQPIADLQGPVVHWREFRRQMLAALHDEFDWARFIPDPVPDVLRRMGNFLLYLPEALTAWTRSSRRVFHVTQELQMLLDATSLDGIMWADVVWPFASFTITLDAPIEEDGNLFDCILISRESDVTDRGHELTGCRLFAKEFESYIPVSRFERESIVSALHKKQWQRVQARLEHLPVMKNKSIRSRMVYIEHDIKDLSVTHPVTQLEMNGNIITGGPRDQFMERTLRLVVGFCLYLSVLPSGSPHRSSWSPVVLNTRPDPRAITREAEVCTVSSVHVLSDSQRQFINSHGTGKRGPYELSAHFRRGHWRRVPGQGFNPDAPKIVWVRPTLVRKDRLPQNTLPGGATTIVHKK